MTTAPLLYDATTEDPSSYTAAVREVAYTARAAADKAAAALIALDVNHPDHPAAMSKYLAARSHELAAYDDLHAALAAAEPTPEGT
jgi:hypothetical protein